MVPGYNIREEISSQYLTYWNHHYQHNPPDQLWYIIIYIPVPMRVVCRLYYIRPYWYTYGMRKLINSDNNWYEVIWYIHKKTLYPHIYPSTYSVCVHMILPKHALVHIQDDNNELIWLTYVSNIYVTYVI